MSRGAAGVLRPAVLLRPDTVGALRFAVPTLCKGVEGVVPSSASVVRAMAGPPCSAVRPRARGSRVRFSAGDRSGDPILGPFRRWAQVGGDGLKPPLTGDLSQDGGPHTFGHGRNRPMKRASGLLGRSTARRAAGSCGAGTGAASKRPMPRAFQNGRSLIRHRGSYLQARAAGCNAWCPWPLGAADLQEGRRPIHRALARLLARRAR